MKVNRKKKRLITLGKVKIGADTCVKVQSMTSTFTSDILRTLSQIRRLSDSGCEIIRVSVPDNRSLAVFPKIIKESPRPVIADIHYSPRLAQEVIKMGASGIRINPGNIGLNEELTDVLRAALDRNCCIRIGVNSGSLDKRHLTKKGRVTARGLVNSALEFIEYFESKGFYNTKVSIKSSSVGETIEANRLFHSLSDYPIHLGVTEAGTVLAGSIRSSVAMGILLSEGIGDTIRVSLACDPVKEVYVAYEILKSLGLRERGVTVIACPTCSRKSFDVCRVAENIEKKLSKVADPITVAVMGCIVNGPGEAKGADVGVAGGKGLSVLFEKGRIIKKIKPGDIEKELLKRVQTLIKK